MHRHHKQPSDAFISWIMTHDSPLEASALAHFNNEKLLAVIPVILALIWLSIRSWPNFVVSPGSAVIMLPEVINDIDEYSVIIAEIVTETMKQIDNKLE